MRMPVSVFCVTCCAILFWLNGCSRTAPTEADHPVTDVSAANCVPLQGELLPSNQVTLLEEVNTEYTRLVQAVLPGVVSIQCLDKSTVVPLPNFSQDFPFQFHFGPDFKPQPDAPEENKSLGSGIIFNAQGYIVTNYHVITHTQDIQVGLLDHRLVSARLIGADEAADIAVLKIEADHLTALPWGDSDQLQVGEQVFAIGNPFELNDSVSNGIVSAKDRNLPDSANYQDYIQTNAAINPGNSGGALVNIHGQVVGINAAIASTSRVNMGIAFAIPSNLARFAVESLLKNGRVIRGYLGVSYKDVPIAEAVRNNLHLQGASGVLINEVKEASPAEQAGLKPLDFITAIRGVKISQPADLRLLVSLLTLGQTVQIDFIRDGQPQSVQATIVAQPEQVTFSPPVPVTIRPVESLALKGNALSGLHVTEINEQTRQQFDLESDLKSGLVVVEVEGNSLATIKDLEPGDVLLSVCWKGGTERALHSMKDFSDLALKLKPEDSLLLLVQRGHAVSQIDMTLPR